VRETRSRSGRRFFFGTGGETQARLAVERLALLAALRHCVSVLRAVAELFRAHAACWPARRDAGYE